MTTTFDDETLTKLFTYVAPTPETTAKYAELHAAFDKAAHEIAANAYLRISLTPQQLFANITTETLELARVVNRICPPAADTERAITHIRIARMAANKIVLEYSKRAAGGGKSATEAVLVELLNQSLQTAAFLANASVALGSVE